MNKNEKFAITINRELGSGGRTVGRLLAERLAVPYYDKALIMALEKKYNLSVEEIERMKGKSVRWWSDFNRVMRVGENPRLYVDKEGDEPDVVTTEVIFKAEKEILQAIAQDESCVIAGRTGFFVLKDHPNHLSILIQASMEHRLERVMRKKKISEDEARKIIQKVDNMREKYVNKFAHTSRYDARNYDLVINMDGKTEEDAADLIMRYIG
jgi:cytidylate kinase